MTRAEVHLRTLAAAAGFRSLHALARDAHVDRLTLRFALRGQRTPHRSTVERVAAVLRVEARLVDQVFASARADHARAA